ncbi:hypothetical protein DRQ07_00660 [candidate division KSB1 bacterium]|nr:MAG: hypothetical protein DRQ07_00660 [candidate division KSB1 bacterium]
MWQKRIKELAAKHNMEIHSEESVIYFIHPRKLDKSVKAKFEKEIPFNYTCEFIERFKSSTQIMLFSLLTEKGIFTVNQTKRVLTIRGNFLENPEALFTKINKILHSDGYFDSWTFISGDFKRTGYFFIPDNQLDRDTIIQKDEITNLIISLKTAKTVDEFLKQI